MNQSLHPEPRCVMYAYPWDLYDHGVDTGLESLQERGIDAIQLAFSYHVGTFLHPRNPERRVHYGEQGALHFDPSILPERMWPVAPPVSANVTGPRYMADLLDAAAARGISTIAWVVYLYNHTLARARPDLAVRNAYDDPNGAQLCPANPTVRDYARALTHAVTRHGPLSGFVCESLSYLPYDYGFLNLKAAVVPGARARLLLSLCFCQHCCAAARAEGVQVGVLGRQVRAAVDDHLARLPDSEPEGEAGDGWTRHAFEGNLQAYLDAREQVAGSLQQEVLGIATDAGLRVGSTSAEGEDARISGVPDSAIRDHRDELRIELLPDMDAAAVRELVQAARVRAGRDGVPISALAQLGHFASEREFIAAFASARDLGIDHFRIYQFGLLTRRQMDWLRRARPLWSDGRREGQNVTRGRN